MKSERPDKTRLRLHKKLPIVLPSPPLQIDPCLLIVFGAGGDLTKRKLIPAIYNLAKAQLLPENFAVVGFSRRISAIFNSGRDDFRFARANRARRS